jgi:hypothetical protein
MKKIIITFLIAFIAGYWTAEPLYTPYGYFYMPWKNANGEAVIAAINDAIIKTKDAPLSARVFNSKRIPTECYDRWYKLNNNNGNCVAMLIVADTDYEKSLKNDIEAYPYLINFFVFHQDKICEAIINHGFKCDKINGVTHHVYFAGHLDQYLMFNFKISKL